MNLQGNERYLSKANNYVCLYDVEKYNWKTIPQGAVCFAKVGAALLLNRRRIATSNCLIDNNMMAAVPKEPSMSVFLYWLFQTIDFADFVQIGALPSVNQKQLSNIEVYIPSNQKEQKTIATILDTIAEAIAAAESQLAKQEKIKQGLLQDLLTRGIDETGEIRPHWEDRPDLYKKSELGFVPNEWVVRELKDVATLQRGFDLPNQDRKTGAFPIYGSNGIDGWHSKPAIHEPGVITGRSGSIGFVYFSPVPFWPLNTTLYVKNFHENNKRFIKLLLQFLDLKKYAASTGVPSLNRNFVHPELVRVPKLDEQNLIVQMEEVSDGKLKEIRAEIKKLQKIKTGLMQDLLTGQRRVTPELIRQVENLTGTA